MKVRAQFVFAFLAVGCGDGSAFTTAEGIGGLGGAGEVVGGASGGADAAGGASGGADASGGATGGAEASGGAPDAAGGASGGADASGGATGGAEASGGASGESGPVPPYEPSACESFTCGSHTLTGTAEEVYCWNVAPNNSTQGNLIRVGGGACIATLDGVPESFSDGVGAGRLLVWGCDFNANCY